MYIASKSSTPDAEQWRLFMRAMRSAPNPKVLLNHSYFEQLRVRPDRLIMENTVFQCLNGPEGARDLRHAVRELIESGESTKMENDDTETRKTVEKKRTKKKIFRIFSNCSFFFLLSVVLFCS